MKKFLSSILIVFVFANFLAPISVGISKENNKIILKQNIANAEEACVIESITLADTTTPSDSWPKKIDATIKTKNCEGKRVVLNVKEVDGRFNLDDHLLQQIFSPNKEETTISTILTATECEDECKFNFLSAESINNVMTRENATTDKTYTCDEKCKENKDEKGESSSFIKEGGELPQGQTGEEFTVNAEFETSATDKTAKITIEKLDIEMKDISGGFGRIDQKKFSLTSEIKKGDELIEQQNLPDIDVGSVISFNNLESETAYLVTIRLNLEIKTTQVVGQITQVIPRTIPNIIDRTIPITTNKDGDTGETDQGSFTLSAESGNSPDGMPVCDILNGAFGGKGTFMGCIAQMFYYVVFVPTSYFFGLMGKLFDWTFAYSVNDESYRSTFVVQGWGVVRDMCNIFFIFVLLYIAFMTILNIKSSKTKELIVNVIIIGLVINFSLFATRVLIDTSNILARVFYNSNTIKIEEKGSSREPKDGIIPLSEGIVGKMNPVQLIKNANNAVDHSQTARTVDGSSNKKESSDNLTTGNFIIVTLLASIVNVIGALTFLTVSIVFVSRVVGLWIMMIVSPLAFLTYAIPQLEGKKMIGWKKWWPETISLAFLAPVFMFFMYIILQFMETGLGVISAGSGGKKGLDWVVSISVPFIFIIVLLNKAKSIAKDMSGELGQQITNGISKAASMAGGLAMGAATGGAALLGRSTIGGLASKVASSEGLKNAASKGGFTGFMASKALKAGEVGSKASFDIRNTKAAKNLGGIVNKETGLNINAGKGKTGGYVADVDRQVKKNDERAKRVEMSGTKAIEQDKKAKEWKDKYEEEMYAKRASDEKEGKVFDEKEFKENYIREKGEIKSSSQINKERLRERKESIENKNIRTGFIPNKDVKTYTIKNLEDKIGGEKKGLSSREKYYTEREKDRTQKSLENTEIRRSHVQAKLTQIADENELNQASEVTEEHVKNSINEREAQIGIAQIETEKMKKEMEKFKNLDTNKTSEELEIEFNEAKREQEEILAELERNINEGRGPSVELEEKNRLNEIKIKKVEEQKKISEIKKKYTEKQAEIRQLKQETSEFGSLLENRKKLEELEQKQKEDINKLDDKLNGVV